MRMTEDRIEDASACDLLLQLLDGGVSLVHVSSEYESFPRFTKVLRAARQRSPGTELAVIAKVAVPHFGEGGFDPTRFEEKVDGYLQALDLKRLDVVQWLLRHDLS